MVKIAATNAPIRFYAVAGPMVDFLFAVKAYEFDQGTSLQVLTGFDYANFVVLGFGAGFGVDFPVGKCRLGMSAGVESNLTHVMHDSDMGNTVVGLRLNSSMPYPFGKENK
jgi:hypothetical protein